MKNKHKTFGFLIAVTVLLLAACLLPPLPRSKVRGSRVQSVNHVATVSFTVTSTNGIPAITNKK